MAETDQYGEPVHIEMKAGRVSLHRDMLLHGSAFNRSDRRRCGLTLRYMSLDVRTRAPDSAEAFICRGRDPSGYWIDRPLPEGDRIP